MSQPDTPRDTSHAVQLFQDAHQKMVMLKRVDEQMQQLLARRRTLMDELRGVQSQINDEFDRMFNVPDELPARGLAPVQPAAARNGGKSSGPFDASELIDDDAAVA